MTRGVRERVKYSRAASCMNSWCETGTSPRAIGPSVSTRHSSPRYTNLACKSGAGNWLNRARARRSWRLASDCPKYTFITYSEEPMRASEDWISSSTSSLMMRGDSASLRSWMVVISGRGLCPRAPASSDT